MNAGVPIDDRIRAALNSPASSAEIAIVIHDASQAAAEATRAIQSSEKAALDPATPAQELPAARKALDDATFLHARLSKALDDLNTRFEAVLAAEQADDEKARHAAALARQEAAAVRLKERYPVLAAELADILQACEAADRAGARITGKTCRVLAGWSVRNNPVERVKLPKPGQEGQRVWPTR